MPQDCMVEGGNCWNHASCAGDGRHGSKVFESFDYSVVNTCLQVASFSGSTLTLVYWPPFEWTVGDRFLVWVVRTRVADNTAGSLDATALNNAGLWHMARLSSVSGPEMTLDSAPGWAHDSDDRTVVCNVPEYEHVTLNREVSPSNLPVEVSNSGGILAFFASGDLAFNTFSISAKGMGFYGGSSNYNPDAVCENTPRAAGQNGAGLHTALQQANTFRRNSVGGGGGVMTGGGAGGGHVGAGGAGSPSACTPPDTSQGGATLLAAGRLLLGGGGGGAVGMAPGGASGGGVILVFAHTVIDEGVIDASGDSPYEDEFNTEPRGGGGAGGTVIVWSAEPQVSGTVLARGGNGGSVNNAQRGSGGGGGGRLRMDERRQHWRLQCHRGRSRSGRRPGHGWHRGIVRDSVETALGNPSNRETPWRVSILGG